MTDGVEGHRVSTAFYDLVKDLQLNYARSPWAREQGFAGWVRSLQGEVQELLDEAFGNKPSRCPTCIHARRDHVIKFDHVGHHPDCGAFGFGPGDAAAISEELGDVIGNIISLVIAQRAAGGADLVVILENARAKLHRRKPWLFDHAEAPPKTVEEENILYAATKQRVG